MSFFSKDEEMTWKQSLFLRYAIYFCQTTLVVQE